MPALRELSRGDAIALLVVSLLFPIAFASLGGVVNILWIASTDGGDDPLLQALPDRLIRWALFVAAWSFCAGIFAGLRHNVMPVWMGFAFALPGAVAGALAGGLWTWVEMGVWPLVPDLVPGIAIGSLVAVPAMVAAARNILNVADACDAPERVAYDPTDPASGLRASKLALIADMIGEICTSVELLVMRDCGEEFDGDTSTGFIEVTWGLSLRYGSDVNLILASSGHRISAYDSSWGQGMSSLLTQSVSAVPPWDAYVGSALEGFEILTCGSPPSPWGVELRFSSARLLIAAVQWCHAPDYLLVMEDEILIVYDSDTIDRLLQLRVETDEDDW